jgi:hypothetical protein
MWLMFIVAAFLVPAAAFAVGTAGDNSLAKRPAAELLAFHVKDRDFKPVDVAPWVYTHTLQAFVSVEQIDEAATWGVNVVHGSGPDPYFPLMKDDPNGGPPAEVRASVKAFVAKARAKQMKVIVGINPAAPANVAKAHPEWMLCPTSDVEAIHAKGKAADLSKPESWSLRVLGLNSLYGDMLIENLAEIMKEFDVDGFSFDGNYHLALNYAPYERELYAKETGHPFPEKVDLNDVAYRLYLIWADDKLEGWYRKLHDRLRQVKPDSAAIYTWTTNAGRFGHFIMQPRVMSTRMNRVFDSPVQEWWLDEVNQGSTLVPAFGAAYVRAVTGGRTGASEPYLMSRGNPYCGDNFPPHELMTRCLMAFANGSMTPLSTGAMKEASANTIKELKRRTPYFIKAEQMPWAAVLVSEQTRQFYAYRDTVAQFLSHSVGVFRAAYESHLPLNLVNDWDITPQGLSAYKVLFLPNTACLSEEQAQTIRDWVAGGGGLVATCETSLFDEIGRPRGDFALKDVFGVSYQGRVKASTERPQLDVNFAIVVNEEYWAKRQGFAALRPTPATEAANELLKGSFTDDPAGLTFKGPLVKMSYPVPLTEQLLMMFPDAGADTLPAGVIRTFGKGRVVYFPIGLDAANFSYGFRYTRALLARSMEWAASEAFPITVKAPMCVQSTFFRQKDEKGERIVVHLFNDLNTTSNHGLSEVDVPLREEAVPIHGIKVTVQGLNVTRVHVEPEGVEVKPEMQGDTQVIDVPPVSIHSMVVLERR